MSTNPNRPPRLYIAHPYRDPSPEVVKLNIQAARLAGVAAAKAGWYPVMPTVNTAGFDLLLPDIPDSFWLKGALGLLATCDAILLAGEWESSTGCQAECKEANRLGIPIYAPPGVPAASLFLQSLAARDLRKQVSQDEDPHA